VVRLPTAPNFAPAAVDHADAVAPAHS
jgi:hypothetical protein